MDGNENRIYTYLKMNVSLKFQDKIN